VVPDLGKEPTAAYAVKFSLNSTSVSRAVSNFAQTRSSAARTLDLVILLASAHFRCGWHRYPVELRLHAISQTTVRNVVGRFSLDQLLSDTASINLQIKNVIDGHTEPWRTQVTAIEIKDIVLPDKYAARNIITQQPVALQLRTLQTMAEISVGKNSTIIFPAQFMATVREAVRLMPNDSESK
jgi:regulator of protease activity HflC (stomatin/prohibitin superfamily)